MRLLNELEEKSSLFRYSFKQIYKTMKIQVSLYVDKDEKVALSLAIDATKVTKIISVNHKFKVIIEGFYSNHYILTLGLSK